VDIREPGARQQHACMRIAQAGYMVVHRKSGREKDKRPGADASAQGVQRS